VPGATLMQVPAIGTESFACWIVSQGVLGDVPLLESLPFVAT
jgi:hypothetical protein